MYIPVLYYILYIPVCICISVLYYITGFALVFERGWEEEIHKKKPYLDKKRESTRDHSSLWYPFTPGISFVFVGFLKPFSLTQKSISLSLSLSSPFFLKPKSSVFFFFLFLFLFFFFFFILIPLLFFFYFRSELHSSSKIRHLCAPMFAFFFFLKKKIANLPCKQR